MAIEFLDRVAPGSGSATRCNPEPETTVIAALETVAAGAAERDRTAGTPPFPAAAFAALDAAGALDLPADLAGQLAQVRAVSAADGAVGRIYDGHLNALERLAAHGVDPGPGLQGVWGADPGPGEGEPARVDGDVLRGVKTYCSGAGGLSRALVLAGGLLVHVDLTTPATTIDAHWYRASGLRASCSHRVVFDGAPILAVLGGPGEIAAQPWFARDATRTTATWAGLADAAAAAAHALLAGRPKRGDLEGLAAGRIETAHRTIELWLAEAARRGAASDAQAAATTAGAGGGPAEPPDGAETIDAAFAVHLRDAVAGAARALLDEAVRACGSRPLATADGLDRARRDLEVFLLQHRLDPLVARAGTALLDAARP